MIIHPSVKKILSILAKHKFDAYLVGGCVRSLLLENPPPPAGGFSGPKDWDATTNAKPDDILTLFTKAGHKAFYENKFGTVTVIIDELPVEITPFRLEGKYSDKRRPDEIKWAKTIEEDLARRDFTVNAMALSLETHNMKRETKRKGFTTLPSQHSAQGGKHDSRFTIVDIFEGQKDLKAKVIRTVGDPHERFSEDALRLMRAVRLSVELGFTIEEKTLAAVSTHAKLLAHVAHERIRDEFTRIIASSQPDKGVQVLHGTGLLAVFLPELEEGVNVVQRGPHRYDVFSHNLFSLRWASRESNDVVVRLAALFHDIGKPRVKQETDGKITFYDHPSVGAKMAIKALERLNFSRKIVEEVSHLVYHHMFYYDVGKVSASGVRRLLGRVGGKEVFDNLLIVRRADRRATPVPKTHPYRLRHLEYMVEKVAHDPLSRFQLVVNGEDIKKALDIPEGKRIGLLIQALLAQVLEDPKRNTKENLLKETKKLHKKSDEQLQEQGKLVFQKQKERDKELKGKHYIK